MKLNTLIRSALIGAALTASSLFANTVVLTSTGFNGNPNAGAGEFLAQTSHHGDFLTFCMEYSVQITLGATYSYTIDNVVLNQGDALSKGSAHLYVKFLNGTLSGPAAGSGANGTYLGLTDYRHDVNAGLLQKAFWMLENEIAYDSTNYYIALVEGIFGSQAAAMKNVGTNSSVKVLNVWGTNARGGQVDKQSQLIMVPDSGMTALLLGLGLLSLAAFRRKL
jgi:hypothetical protein